MNPSLDPADHPDELPPSAKLQPGYVRYIRISSEQGPTGEICLETCIRRTAADDYTDLDINGNPKPQSFFYSAVSYTWGDPTPRHPIIVDGRQRLVADNLFHFLQCANLQRSKLQDAINNSYEGMQHHRRQFLDEVETLRTEASGYKPSGIPEKWEAVRAKVTETLKEIIRLQRFDWPGNWLWIDALCIDQADAAERTHQVGVMSQIFGMAGQVVCWLGPTYDGSDCAITAMARYSTTRNSKNTDSPSNDDHVCANLAEAICRLCERPYWSRLWVFQELKHAKHILLLCGQAAIPWATFADLWHVMVDSDIVAASEHDSERLRHSLATRMIMLRTKPMLYSLWSLLIETRNLQCADPRDRLFALLSVACEGHEGIAADYKQHTFRPVVHRILRNRYAHRPPRTLGDVVLDCEFLESVFRMSQGAMLQFPRWPDGRYAVKSSHEEQLLVDAKSPCARRLWFAWADRHDHPAVVDLLESKKMLR